MSDGGPAFPIQDEEKDHWGGMSLRDWFAGMALQGMIACHDPDGETTFGNPKDSTEAAEWAYNLGAAMLREREKRDAK